MTIKRGTILFKFLWHIDNVVSTFDGFVPDFERLGWCFSQRPLFSKEGLIKQDISMIPFRDRALKRVANQFGGWQEITKPSYVPTDDLYQALEKLGFASADFDKTREYKSGFTWQSL